MTTLTHSERQRLEEVKARSQAWQKSGERPESPERLQHDLFFLLLVIQKFEESDRK